MALQTGTKARKARLKAELRPKAPEVIRLLFREADRKVFVEPEDQDRYMQTVAQVLNALHDAQDKNKAIEQFGVLKDRLGSWVQERKDKIEQAFLTFRDSDLLFLIIRREVGYDTEFEDELSDLELEIANNEELDQIEIEALALPRVEPGVAESFLSSLFRLEYTGIENG